MAKALKCDRCGGFFDYIKCLRRYQITDMDEKNFNKAIDLCPECYNKFLNFLEENRREMDHQEIFDTSELYPGNFEEESNGSE